MKTIGITGSIASGKTTVAHLMAGKRFPLFSADTIVSNLYKKKNFNKILIKKFKLNSKKQIKEQIKLVLKRNKDNLYKLESIIHPFVQKEMISFLKKKNKTLFFEIPLLIESKLNKYFDKIIFVEANKKLRLKRYINKKGDKNTFSLLDKRQIPAALKKNICDYTVNNNYSLAILKKNVKNLIKKI
jgi:dephospho-CoA kinase|tara:strand:- start:3422 stop:3979 length:558 start_codon:yes stop_codon:yes gene_type:complete